MDTAEKPEQANIYDVGLHLIKLNWKQWADANYDLTNKLSLQEEKTPHTTTLRKSALTSVIQKWW